MNSPPAAPDAPRVIERSRRICLHLAFWVPLAACTYLALTPAPPEAVFRVSDVVLHALAFSYLTFALGLAVPTLSRLRIVVWMLAYGLLLELLQSFEPERSAELKDLAVDGAGIALGLLLLRTLGPWSRRVLERLLSAVLERSN